MIKLKPLQFTELDKFKKAKGVYPIMSFTGITRRLDELGRVVLPIEIRNKLNLNEKDGLQIWLEGNDIILRKEECTCIFCGKATKDLQEYKDKRYCKKCIDTIMKKEV